METPKGTPPLAFDIISRGEEEIAILFPMTNASRLQAKTEALKLLQEAALSRGVKIRILVPCSDIHMNDRRSSTTGREFDRELYNFSPTQTAMIVMLAGNKLLKALKT